ncbi:hypothetical protein Tco_0510861 [Tanacetum coccineum]
MRAKVKENQIMAASAIANFFLNSSRTECEDLEPCANTHNISFCGIPTVILYSGCAPETSTIALLFFILPLLMVEMTSFGRSHHGLCGLVPYSGSDSDSPDEMSSPKHISPLLAISPFLCTDSFKAPDSSDGPPS